VGNIFTLPRHRGRGYGGACTSAVCAALLNQSLTIVLNVSVENQPAVRLYQRLGFEQHCVYYETMATKTKKENAYV
jgi:predicted GNAT family acetyltransferase